MKSLDINSVNIASGDYREQQVKIEYVGGFRKGKMQHMTQIVTVDYNCFSNKLQSIHRLGGKIVNVSIPRLQIDLPEISVDQAIAIMPEHISAIAPDHDQHPKLEIATSLQVVDTEPQQLPENISEIIADQKNQSDRHESDVIAECKSEQEPLETIADSVTTPEETAEIHAVNDSETSEVVVDVVKEVLEVTDAITEPSSSSNLTKPKKNKAKSGHGFNKSKSDH